MAELFGKATGVCSGKGGTLHSADASGNNFGDTVVEGSFKETALGAASGWKMQRENSLSDFMVGADLISRGYATRASFSEIAD